MAEEQPRKSGIGPGKRVLFFLIVNVVFLLAIEGLASSIVVAYRAAKRLPTLAERVHTRYDPELGWVNVPDLSIPDMYGPGISLRTNAQGFRNDRPFPTAVPSGRVRIVCSGDSFTLGYGVANDDAWCNSLAAIDSRIESVNMGQAGYGVDQSYLWYRRDGLKIDHDIHVFAFIGYDFERMRHDRFSGYGKPVLVLDHERLAVRNVPVPRRSALATTLSHLAREAANFRTVELIRRVVVGSPPPPGGVPGAVPDAADRDALRPVVEKLFESLHDLHAQRGRTLVLVYLPVQEEYAPGEPDPWRTFVHEAAARQGIPLIDLVPDLQAVSGAEAETFFIKPGEVRYGDAAGHYTLRGNQFVARALYRKLLAIDGVAAKLGAAAAPAR